MNKLEMNDVAKYLEDGIDKVHQKRLESLGALNLAEALMRENPYLLKGKYGLMASNIARELIDVHVSFTEEGIFDDLLQGLAIFINEKVYAGKKSSAQGVDLEFDKEGKRYLVAIKSGPNWGNSSQIKKMVLDFKTAKKILRTSGANMEVVAVNGCCYGTDNQPDKGDFYKYCGQRFWSFISGDEDLYTKIIEPLGNMAKERNEDFIISYSNKLNKFTLDFSKDFCAENGAIDWEKIVRYNSEAKK